jgi:hypothetical protein
VAIAALASVAICAPGQPTIGHAHSTESAARELRTDEVELLYSAEQLLVTDCMTRKGFRYWVNPRNPVPELRDFVYGVDDVEWARRNGYGGYLQRRLDQVLNANPNRQYAQRLTGTRRAAYLEALNGTPDAGTALTATLPSGITVRRSSRSCTSEAQRELYVDLPAWYRAVKVTEAVPLVAYGLAQADGRLKAAVGRWSACMHAAGHPFADPQQPRASVTTTVADAPSPQEVRLAVAEATCAQGTGLADTARTVNGEYTRQVETRYRTEVTDKRRLAVAALPRAHEVLRRH